MNIAKKTLEGRPHLIIPCVMLVEGVLTGSGGSLLYLQQDLQKSVALWNAKPVLAFHPDLYVSPIAGNPAIFDQQKIGTIFNSRMDGNRLKADLWLDAVRCNIVDARILTAIDSGEMLEISTGLFSDNQQKTGTFNGKTFDAIARNYRPDHLAVLIGQVGACSLKDGCGLMRTNAQFVTPLPQPATCF